VGATHLEDHVTTLNLPLRTGDTLSVTAQETSTKGLFVHPAVTGSGYTLTHQSGYAVAVFSDASHAHAAADRIGWLINWGRPAGRNIETSRETVWRLADAIEEFNGTFVSGRTRLGLSVSQCRRNGYPAPWEGDCGH
jgi:ApbE superfamily uncharacterized protein (UPF0280 family)